MPGLFCYSRPGRSSFARKYDFFFFRFTSSRSRTQLTAAALGGHWLGDADNGRFANHPLQVQENSAISVFLLCATIHGLLYLLKYHSVCSVIVLMS